jgi:hypothetical protein
MHLRSDRLAVGDRVELRGHDARGTVVEVLGRDLVRTFRDGSLEVCEVGRYCVLLPTGRTVVVNDRGGRLRRIPAPLAPPPPRPHELVRGAPAAPRG